MVNLSITNRSRLGGGTRELRNAAKKSLLKSLSKRHLLNASSRQARAGKSPMEKFKLERFKSGRGSKVE